jgi:hypothetical protein
VRSARLGLLAFPLALLAACASSNGPRSVEPAHPVARSSGPVATTSGGPTAAQNKAYAQSAADQLVAKASLPPGAVGVRIQPVGLTGPALGTPGVSQLIDTVKYYSLPMSLSQAYAWFRANPQHGLTPSGTSSGSDPRGAVTYGFQYDPIADTHSPWGTASLQIGLVTQGSTTGVRVDGVAQWIDPTPTRDASHGPKIRVTIAGGCPASDRGLAIGNPDAPDLDHQLLPAATPIAALKCTYDGLNGHPFRLASSQHLNATQAAAAAAVIRAVPLGSRGLEARNCPADDARANIVVFAYPGRADVDIWEHTAGCPSTDNGHIVADDF